MEQYRIDLHTHSQASDGSFTPIELAEHAHELGLVAIALTDHDTVSGLPDFIKRTEELDNIIEAHITYILTKPKKEEEE